MKLYIIFLIIFPYSILFGQEKQDLITIDIGINPINQTKKYLINNFSTQKVLKNNASELAFISSTNDKQYTFIFDDEGLCKEAHYAFIKSMKDKILLDLIEKRFTVSKSFKIDTLINGKILFFPIYNGYKEGGEFSITMLNGQDGDSENARKIFIVYIIRNEEF